jgi:hypothetical protein
MLLAAERMPGLGKRVWNRHHAEPDEHEVGAPWYVVPGNRGDPGTGAARDQTEVPAADPAVRDQMIQARAELAAELGIERAGAEQAGVAPPR